MITQSPYPKDGLLVLPDGSKWFHGQGSSYDEKLKRHKTYYLFLPKSESCDRHNANACQKRAPWYGYEIERTGYIIAIYKCPKHGKIRLRCVDASGPEIRAFLKKKHAKK